MFLTTLHVYLLHTGTLSGLTTAYTAKAHGAQAGTRLLSTWTARSDLAVHDDNPVAIHYPVVIVYSKVSSMGAFLLLAHSQLSRTMVR